MTREEMACVGSDKDVYVSSTGHDRAAPEWLDVHFMGMQPEYEEMLHWMGLQPGWHVLDAACGSGSFLPLMTELVGGDGMVSAIDLAPENIRTVEKRAEQSNWPAPVFAREGSILDLPYDDNTFDAVWCANTTQYLTDDELLTMLAEFRRVTRTGGLIAIKEYDVTAQQVQPTTPTLFIHMIDTLWRNGDQYYANLLRAIELPKWLRAAGLIDLRQKSTFMVRLQPLDWATKQFLAEGLPFFYQQAQKADLPEEEMRLWRQLANTDSPDHIFHHPDFQYRTIQTVFVGHVPE